MLGFSLIISFTRNINAKFFVTIFNQETTASQLKRKNVNFNYSGLAYRPLTLGEIFIKTRSLKNLIAHFLL